MHIFSALPLNHSCEQDDGVCDGFVRLSGFAIFAIPCIFNIVSVFHSQATDQSFDNSCRTKTTNNAPAVNDFIDMHCLAKANSHIVSAVNNFPHLDLPSLHGVDFTDVANAIFTAICSKYPSFMPTLEALGCFLDLN
jgi:hypothetical protein